MRIVLNPDDREVKTLQIALEENDGYCPCMVEKKPETKCMCKEFRDQIRNKIPGACHCGLWIAVED
jgi:ferredoxin-thioredoxin reductase catalytic subunit